MKLLDNEEIPPYEAVRRKNAAWISQAQEITKLPIKRTTGEVIFAKKDQPQLLKKARHQQPEIKAVNGKLARSSKRTQSIAETEAQVPVNGDQGKDAVIGKNFKKQKLRRNQVASQHSDPHTIKNECLAKPFTKLFKQHHTLEEKKQLIARTAQKILSNPEEALPSIELLFQLFEKAESVCKGAAFSSYKILSKSQWVKSNLKTKMSSEDAALICKLSLVSLGAIMKDLFPVYNAVESKGVTITTTVSKATAQLQAYEQQLKKYIQKLLLLLKQRLKAQHTLVIPIFCELLKSGVDSEFGEELITLCVRSSGLQFNLNVPEENHCVKQGVFSGAARTFKVSQTLSQLCCESLIAVIQRDPTLKVAVKVVKAVGALAKDFHTCLKKNKESIFRLTEGLLSVVGMLDIKINQALLPLEEFSFKGTTAKEAKKLSRDIRKSTIQADKAEVSKLEGIILNELFVLYLRILSSANLYSEDIVAASLRGISLLGHLVNVEWVYQLYNELRRLLVEGEALHPFLGVCAIDAVLTLLINGKGDLQVENSWICAFFCRILHSSLPLFACGCVSSCMNSLTPLNSVDIRSFATDSYDPSDPMQPPLHWLRKHCEFSQICLKTLDRLLQHGKIFGSHTATRNMEQLLELFKCLLGVAVHSDIFVSYALLSRIQELIARHPRLKSALQLDGAVLSCLTENVSYFWQMELFSCHISSLTRQIYWTLMSTSASDDLTKRLLDQKANLGFILDAYQYHSAKLHKSGSLVDQREVKQFAITLPAGAESIPINCFTAIDFDEFCMQPQPEILFPTILAEAYSVLSSDFKLENDDFAASSTRKLVSKQKQKLSLMKAKLISTSHCCNE